MKSFQCCVTYILCFLKIYIRIISVLIKHLDRACPSPWTQLLCCAAILCALRTQSISLQCLVHINDPFGLLSPETHNFYSTDTDICMSYVWKPDNQYAKIPTLTIPPKEVHVLNNSLRQESENYFCKEPDCKYFRICDHALWFLSILLYSALSKENSQ